MLYSYDGNLLNLIKQKQVFDTVQLDWNYTDSTMGSLKVKPSLKTR